MAPSDIDLADPHIDPAAPVLDDDLGEDSAADAVEGAAPWRVAAALETLRDQINAAAPGRNTASDGTIGDDRHRTRVSDHNAHVSDGGFGVVTALDVTHDPARGCDAGLLVAALHASRDPRIKYLIWNRRIANSSAIGGAAAWAWRAYTGSNPHDKHCHISVKADKALYDDAGPWTIQDRGRTEAVAAAEGVAEEGTDEETLLRNALAALGGAAAEHSLLRDLIAAQDSLTLLLARNARQPRAEVAEGTEAAPDADLLRAEYLDLWERCQVRPERRGEVAWHRDRLLRGRPRYEAVAEGTKAPWWFIGIVHALEASFSFTGHLHNGDPLGARTVQVPRGRPLRWNPPSDWESSAVDAIAEAGNAGKADWSLGRVLYRLESYNGFGYRPRGIFSPYLWSFSNHYTAGKFVADGRYSPTAVSRQCGAAVMLKALANAGDLALDV